jgi:hypothetical protein
MDETTGEAPKEPTTSPAGDQPSGDSWDDLGRQLRELGAAISRAVQAAVDDPENKRRAAELRDDVESMARTVAAAFDEAADSPHGQRVKEEVGKAAETVAAAGRKVADDVRPHLIDAARIASEKLREAAAGMEKRANAASKPEEKAPPADGEGAAPAPTEQKEDQQ